MEKRILREVIMSNAPVYGVGAEFKSATELYHAAEVVRDKGFKWWDTYSPYPIHGMENAMGTGKSWVSMFVLGRNDGVYARYFFGVVDFDPSS